MKRVLLWILNIFSPSEKPSEDELMALGAERERRQQERRARVCEVHHTERLRCIGPGKYVCPICLWEPVSVPPVQQVPFPDIERSTDKVMRPNQVYRQAMQHGAGPHTAAVQAARRTVKLSPDSDRRL